MTAVAADRSVSARRRIDHLRATNPAAADLATLLSTAVRAEPDLVRRLRLLLPAADVAAELDLWTSDILGSASPLAISLDPACAEQLRAELAGPVFDRLRDRAGALITASHGGLHWSLRLEEQINRLMVSGDPAAPDQAEQLLYAALGELRARADDPATDPVPVARWLLAALGRLPRALAGTEAGVVAGLSAGAQLDRRFDPPSGRSAVLDSWMPWLLTTARVEPRTVPVRFPAGYLVINRADRDAVPVQVPGTDPLTLDVGWYDGTRTQHRRVLFRAGEEVSLRIPVDEVDLETLAGDRYHLARPAHGARRGANVAGLDFSAHRAWLRPCLDRADLLDSVLDALNRKQVPAVTLTGPAGGGKSVLLGAALDRLEQHGYAVAEHFYGVQPGWDAPETVTSSLQAKLQAATATAAGRRTALVIANSRYDDPAFSQLRSPGIGAQALRDVLGDPAIGDFEVETLVDADRATMQRRTSDFFAGHGADDLALLYFACHGVKDDRGHLRLIATDTRMERLAATAVPARFVADLMNASRAGQVVLILDCCYSGAFVDHSGTDPLIPVREEFSGGRGRTVLSATSATEAAFDGPVRSSGGPQPSAFTAALVEGLRDGAADLDDDGTITVDELYEFALDRIVRETSGARPMTPTKWTFDAAGSTIVATRPGAASPTGWRRRLVALDGVPEGADTEAVIGAMPPGTQVIATARQRLGGDTVIAVDSSVPVCRAMLEHKMDELVLAFGVPPGGAPPIDELIRAADRLPGRLATIIEWLLDQPVGTADLANLPALLGTERKAVVAELNDREWRSRLAAVMVARAGFTLWDLSLLSAAPGTGPVRDLAQIADLINGLVRFRLVRLDGLADAPETVVSFSHPSVVAAVVESSGDLAVAHGTHVVAFPHDDPSAATPYQIANVAHHYARCGASVASIPPARLARSGGYLDLRQRTGGVDALVADLDDLAAVGGAAQDLDDIRLIRGAVATRAEALRAEPDRFVDIVFNALCGFGASALAEEVFADSWRPPLRLAHIRPVDRLEPVWRQDVPVTAAGRWSADQIATAAPTVARLHAGPGIVAAHPGPYSPQPRLLARLGEALVVAHGSSVSIVTALAGRDVPPPVDLPDADATCLLADGEYLYAGLRDGTVTRFGHGERPLLLGHAGAVTALALSPAGLLSASEDGTVRIWGRPDGGLLRVYSRHRAPVIALAVTASGTVLSADDKGRLRWWSAETCADLGTLPGHAARVTAIVPLPDGGAITAGLDGALWRCDLAGTPYPNHRPLWRDGPALLRLAWHEGWGMVAAWGADGMLTWWDAEDGTVRRMLRPEPVAEPVHELLFEPDGTLVVAHAQGLVAYPPPGPTPDRSEDGYLDALAIDAPAQYAMVGTAQGWRNVNVHDLSDGANLSGGVPTVSVAVTEGRLIGIDAQGFATVNVDTLEQPGYRRVVAEDVGTVHATTAWLQNRDGELEELPDVAPRVARTVAALGPDTSAVAAARRGAQRWLAAGDATGRLRLIRVSDAAEMTALPSLAGGVSALVFTRWGRWLVAGGVDGAVCRAALADPRALSVIGGHRAAVTGLAALVDGDDDRVVSCSADGTLRLWDVDTGTLLAVIAGPVGFRAVAARGGTVVARDTDGRLWILAADSDERFTVPPTDRLTVVGAHLYLNRVGPAAANATVEAELLVDISVELRAVRVVAGPRHGFVPGAFDLSLGGAPVAVDGAGRLAVPRRLRPASSPLALVVHQRLRSVGPPGSVVELSLHLTVYSPIWGREDDVVFRPDVRESARRTTAQRPTGEEPE